MPPRHHPNFSKNVLAWFKDHGRKHLPWQKNITPYRVWLSEVMLQQTQVETVIPYFKRFTERFPSIEELANADEDEVLHLWTGLGYYARGRNLLKCAKQIVEQHNGSFPKDPDQLKNLAGIGRSTAGAIASIAYNEPAAILDGNVKRVLTRAFAVEGWPGKPAIEKTLWQIAESQLPRCNSRLTYRHYTQAMMDLGATLCTRSKPACHRCPLRNTCKAKKLGLQDALPEKKPSKTLPVKERFIVLAKNFDAILIQKRPPTGIWGGLWSLPEAEQEQDAIAFCQREFGMKPQQRWPAIAHVFSHYKLLMHPLYLDLGNSNDVTQAGKFIAKENAQSLWYKTSEPADVGLAAPIKKLLMGMEGNISRKNDTQEELSFDE